MISDTSCWLEKDAVVNVGLRIAGEGFINVLKEGEKMDSVMD